VDDEGRGDDLVEPARGGLDVLDEPVVGRARPHVGGRSTMQAGRRRSSCSPPEISIVGSAGSPKVSTHRSTPFARTIRSALIVDRPDAATEVVAPAVA
jgi:hypothetical protein